MLLDFHVLIHALSLWRGEDSHELSDLKLPPNHYLRRAFPRRTGDSG